MCEYYRRISESEEQRTAFLSLLASDLGVQHDAIRAEAKHLSELYSQVRGRKKKKIPHNKFFLIAKNGGGDTIAFRGQPSLEPDPLLPGAVQHNSQTGGRHQIPGRPQSRSTGKSTQLILSI